MLVPCGRVTSFSFIIGKITKFGLGHRVGHRVGHGPGHGLAQVLYTPLLYWPKQEELSLYYPNCFKRYNNVRAIIDCTEVPIQRPSLSKVSSQIYSSYKGRPIAKVLVACTPAGTISFASKVAGGSMSDKDLVENEV